MLYDDTSHTLIEVVTGGTTGGGDRVSREHLEYLSRLKGQTLVDGQFVGQVALTFIFGPSDAEQWMADIKRLGLECRAIDPNTAQEMVLHSGIHMSSEPQTEDGILLPVLREEAAARIDSLVRRRLIAGSSGQGPWVTYGFDSPRTLRAITTEDPDSEQDQLESRALINLAQRELAIHPFQDNMLAVEDEYAVEAVLLLPEVSLDLQKRLGAPQGLVVAAACAGPAIVAPMSNLQVASALAAWCHQRYESTGGRRICADPIIIQEGQPVGLIKTALA